MSETKHVKFGEAQQKELDNVVGKLASSRKAAIEAELDRRLSYRDQGKVQWRAYPSVARNLGNSRFLRTYLSFDFLGL